MKKNIELKTYKGFLIIKDKIIIEVDEGFLDISGYNKRELLGKTSQEVNKILRIDEQVDIDTIEDDSRIFVFTKGLDPIETRITLKINSESRQRKLIFTREDRSLANDNYDLAEKLASNQRNEVAILTYPDLVVINCN